MSGASVADDLDPRVQRTREAVFAATQRLLREEGIDAVTHTRVADEAGVGRATVYRHWPDAGALLAEALHHSHATRIGSLGELEQLPLREAIERVALSQARMLREEPMVSSMLALLERAERDDRYAAARTRVTDAVAEPLEALLRAAQARGELDTDLDLVWAKATLGGPLVFARLVLVQPFSDEQTLRHVDTWCRAVGLS